ncbi:MAG: glycosyltransferase family 4 protein, partial [Candidatus Pacebacteria bacterium]|nr:glycosyltransferase family 4 protein [Candidatus Paceibacterota bacterium]
GGGALESVIENKTGSFFNEQTPESVINIIRNFNHDKFNSAEIRNHALKFDKEIFKDKIREFIEKEYKKFTTPNHY